MRNTNETGSSGLIEVLETRDSLHRMFIHHLIHCNQHGIHADDGIYAAWIKIDSHLGIMIEERRGE